MGIAASLFYSSSKSSEETLYAKVSPTEEQISEQTERWNDVVDFVIADITPLTGLSMSSWIQGSCKFGTQIRPVKKGEEFDIDVGIYFKWSGQPTDGKFTPKQLKALVNDSLERYKTVNSEDVIEVINPPKPRCERIRFTGDFHIDLPCYHLDADRDARMLATENDGWEVSDPKELVKWFLREFEDPERAKVRRHVQYLKCWAGLTFPLLSDRPSSVALTVLVAEAFKTLSSDAVASDDETFHAIVDKIVTRLEEKFSVENPANRSEDLTRRLSSDKKTGFMFYLKQARENAAAALRAGTKLEAALRWAEIFDQFFPIPDQAEVTEATNAVALFRINPEIQVNAQSKDNPAVRPQGRNAIGPIPQNCSIQFEIINADAIPSGATIRWMVRNAGSEAAYLNDMGHRAGNELIAEERSAYVGTHYMDCEVRLGSQLIGFRRVPVTISGMKAPRRNPIAIPHYRRIGKP